MSVNRAELDSLAERLLLRVTESDHPPSIRTLDEIALNLGADRVIWGGPQARADGMLEVIDDQVVVRVRADQGPKRQRFTLAHEIGHLVLVQPDLRLSALRRRCGLEEDERFCDAFAASLLMPRRWVEEEWAERDWGERPEGLHSLLYFSKTSGTSLVATLLRLRNVLDWTQSLLHWRRAGQSWRLIGRTGTPYGVALRCTRRSCDQFASLRRGRQVVDIELRGPRGLYTVAVEVAVRHESAVGLVDLRGFAANQRRRDRQVTRSASVL